MDKDKNVTYQYLLKLLSEWKSQPQIALLFNALFTDKEQQELINRIRIFALLQQGLPQREIAETLGVGIATVSRGAKAYQQHQIDKLLPNLKDCLV